MPKRAFISVIGSLSLGVLTGPLTAPLALADHTNGYHWPTTALPGIQVRNNLTSTSPSYWRANFLPPVIRAWNTPPSNVASVIQLVDVGGTAKAKSCRAESGKIVACNGAFGRNGVWGSAQYWTRGEHITQAVVRMNDSYFDDEAYFAQIQIDHPESGDSNSWRRYTLCHEMGHPLGLGHVDEDNNNPSTGSCMDYTWDSNSALTPNRHDFEQLYDIYVADHAGPGVASTPAPEQGVVDQGMGSPREWGRLVRESKSKYFAQYELDLGGGHKLHTFIVRAR